MAAYDGNEVACSSSIEVEFSNSLEKRINAIAQRLQDLESDVSSITFRVFKQESEYIPRELGKIQHELILFRLKQFPIWEELSSIESDLESKTKARRETWEDIMMMKSEVVNHEQEIKLEQGCSCEIEKKGMEIESEDKTDSERDYFSETFHQHIIDGINELRLESESDLITLNEMMSRTKILRKRTDLLKVALEDLTKRADTLKSSKDHKQAAGQKLKVGEQLTCESIPHQEQIAAVAMSSDAAKEVQKHETEEETTGAVDEKPKIETVKTEPENGSEDDQNSKDEK